MTEALKLPSDRQRLSPQWQSLSSIFQPGATATIGRLIMLKLKMIVNFEVAGDPALEWKCSKRGSSGSFGAQRPECARSLYGRVSASVHESIRLTAAWGEQSPGRRA